LILMNLACQFSTKRIKILAEATRHKTGCRPVTSGSVSWSPARCPVTVTLPIVVVVESTSRARV
jgi:hypothetical protein